MKTYTFPGRLPDSDIHNKQARIVTNRGTIIFTLDDAQAPLAVSSFVFLASQQYFDGLKWHRVLPDFVAQGGDPTGTGAGGPGYTFPDEPVTSEYFIGTVAMANAGPNTNGSQFFITNADDRTKLEKNYTIFGHVTAGLDVVTALQQGDVMQQVTIEPVAAS
ncbi:MAG: peptidylprolyl isomerase [Candidatus Kerfeldbacteria bacterium]|nr:peptidylprolyl isomerase [Candidatus Kerfeldbacteria bacterium]